MGWPQSSVASGAATVVVPLRFDSECGRASCYSVYIPSLCAQVVIAASIMFFQTAASGANIAGTALALSGVLLYSIAKRSKPSDVVDVNKVIPWCIVFAEPRPVCLLQLHAQQCSVAVAFTLSAVRMSLTYADVVDCSRVVCAGVGEQRSRGCVHACVARNVVCKGYQWQEAC